MSWAGATTSTGSVGWRHYMPGTDSGTASGSIWYNSNLFWRRYLPSKFFEKKSKIPLKDFLDMWEKDFRLVEIETKELGDGKIAKRYNVYSDEPYDGYGRHLGIVVILDRVNKVISHEVFNIIGG